MLYLALLGGDCGVSVDELREDPPKGLDTEGEGGDVEQQHIGHISSQDTALLQTKHVSDNHYLHSITKEGTLK